MQRHRLSGFEKGTIVHLIQPKNGSWLSCFRPTEVRYRNRSTTTKQQFGPCEAFSATSGDAPGSETI
jgi:hypothetical protein